jgi:competence protein ComGC
MRHTPLHKSEAFTLVELIGLIVVALFLVLVFLQGRPRVRNKAVRIQCINNLKQIGLAYRIWSNDNGDRYPALQSLTNGGWREFLTNAGQGFLCWTNYAIVANELGNSPKILLCPSDERQPADTFSNLMSNNHLSYFVGVSADDNQPRSLLGGDRNLGAGTKPERDYGFSPKSGRGNDVAIQTNSQAGPVCWSLKIHWEADADGAGNILLGDGSGQQVSSGNFRTNWQPFADPTTNWPAGHVPASPSFRVLFP